MLDCGWVCEVRGGRRRDLPKDDGPPSRLTVGTIRDGVVITGVIGVVDLREVKKVSGPGMCGWVKHLHITNRAKERRWTSQGR